MSTTNGVTRHDGHREGEPSKDGPDPSHPSASEDNEKAPKLAEQIVQLAELQCEMFHDPRGLPYATVNIAQSNDRVIARTMRLDSRQFRTWLAHTTRIATTRTAGRSAIEEALTALEGIAVYDRPKHTVNVRVAECHGTIYVDLADDSGECIEVTAACWRIIDRAPVKFVRQPGMLPLVRPVSGGSVEQLRPFVNLGSDGFYLLLAWLVGSYRPGRPCAALAVSGEQGAAKTTLSKIARKLIDPNVCDLRSPPRNEDDLFIAACNSHVLALDNLSGISPLLSDALCRIITGGGLSKRKLYTDEDETLLDVIRPVIINGIEDVANRPDLSERCIALTLAPIPEGKRRDEDSYWRDFEAAAPSILGALLDGVASALARVDAVRLTDLPRMADFAKWTAAAEPGLGLASGSIAAAYERNRALAVAAALDASPVATALRALLRVRGGKWAGTPTALLEAMTAVVPGDMRLAKTWPKLPNQLTAQLRRLGPALRQTGIDVDPTPEGRGKRRKRWLAIRVTPVANGDAKDSKRTNREDP